MREMKSVSEEITPTELEEAQLASESARQLLRMVGGGPVLSEVRELLTDVLSFETWYEKRVGFPLVKGMECPLGSKTLTKMRDRLEKVYAYLLAQGLGELTMPRYLLLTAYLTKQDKIRRKIGVK